MASPLQSVEPGRQRALGERRKKAGEVLEKHSLMLLVLLLSNPGLYLLLLSKAGAPLLAGCTRATSILAVVSLLYLALEQRERLVSEPSLPLSLYLSHLALLVPNHVPHRLHLRVHDVCQSA